MDKIEGIRLVICEGSRKEESKCTHYANGFCFSKDSKRCPYEGKEIFIKLETKWI